MAYDIDDPQAPWNKDLLYKMTLTPKNGKARVYRFSESGMEYLSTGIRDYMMDKNYAIATIDTWHTQEDRDTKYDKVNPLIGLTRNDDGKYTFGVDSDSDLDDVEIVMDLKEVKNIYRILSRIWTKTQPYDKDNKFGNDEFSINFQRDFNGRKWEPYDDSKYWDMDV